jgi:redox-sensitive bicupin YhaK (pirin superfamily)
MNTIRQISRVFTPRRQPEGDGAEVVRIIGNQTIRNLDPFLMMDHFEVHKPHGFPDHPHRGFETVTFMFSGRCQHEDFRGHSGEIGPGDTQWMTAGRGILHAEMPATDRMEGLQIWVNLRASDKMCDPSYQEKTSSHIPHVLKDGVRVSIIAGESMGVRAETITRTPAYFIDVHMQPESSFEQKVVTGWNCFVYVVSGKICFQEKQVGAGEVVIFDQTGDTIKVTAVTESRFALLAGEPIGEPIVQHGPFVMNTYQEIQQTLQDYSYGRNGFEGARNWKSKIGGL